MILSIQADPCVWGLVCLFVCSFCGGLFYLISVLIYVLQTSCFSKTLESAVLALDLLIVLSVKD